MGGREANRWSEKREREREAETDRERDRQRNGGWGRRGEDTGM